MEVSSIVGLVMLVIGIILFVVEAAMPGFFIGVIATVLVGLGLIGLVVPGLFASWWSPVIALFLGGLATFGSIMIYKKISPPLKAPITVSRDSLVGMKGKVIRTIDPNNLSGKIKIGSRIWSATGSEPIEEGEEIEVFDSEGVHVKVKRVAEEAKEKKDKKEE